MKGLALSLVVLFGLSFCLSAPAADFDGDGTNDIGIFRPSTGLWSIRGGARVYFGSSGDEPVPGDYNGNGTVDIAIFRPSTGLWSVNGGLRTYFGQAGDQPLPGVMAGGGSSPWQATSGGIYYTPAGGGNVGIGIWPPNPAERLEISGNIQLQNNDRLRWYRQGSGSLLGAEIFCYTNNNLVIDTETTGAFIKLRTENNDAQVLVLDGEGQVGIGTDDPNYKLEVRDTKSSLAVAYIANDSTGSSADGLYIKLNSATPGTNNEFIRFYDSGTIVGAIQGDGGTGVTYESGYADIAEWMPRMREDERIVAGDIVGVVAGMISKDTGRADQILVVSAAPGFLGNAPGEDKECRYEKVAFMGKVPIRVMGSVKSGDFIVPSGKNDGTGIAISPDTLTTDQSTRIAGRAWESSKEQGVKLVDCAIGLRAGNQALGYLLEKKDENVARLTSSLRDLEKRIEALESGN